MTTKTKSLRHFFAGRCGLSAPKTLTDAPAFSQSQSDECDRVEE